MAALNHIMYVDDEPDIRVLVEMSLQTLGGFNVTLCSSGQEALARATAIRPDLILLDVMMPDMDGPQTLAALRSLPELADVPIVFMTAKVQPAEIARFRAIGAADVIAKPFDPIALPDQVRAIWDRHAA